jgi:geranylgeranyl reductase
MKGYIMKIVIVGGGVAGSMSAVFLSKYYDVTLIQDKKWDKPCGGGTRINIFDRFGLDKNLIKNKMNYVNLKYHNHTQKIFLNTELVTVIREEFDEALRQKAVENGVKLIYDKFKTLKENRVYTKNSSFEYDILIAADGVHSSVRKEIGLEKIPSVLTFYNRINKISNVCEFIFDEDKAKSEYAWIFPHDKQTHIGNADKEGFNKLCELFDINIKPKGYHIPSWNENIKIQKNNIYFVGDSAGQVMPLTFEGIFYAIYSAKILSNSIINNLDYKKEWDRVFLKKFKFMKMLEKINNSKFRPLLVNIQKFSFVNKWSVKLWQKEGIE